MLERLTSTVKNLRIADIPVGDAILLLIGLGVNEAVIPTIARLIRLGNLPSVVGAGLGIVVKMPAVERFLGPTLANVLSATAIAEGIDQQFNVRARTESVLSKFLPGVSTSGIETSGIEEVAKLGQAEVSEQERRIVSAYKVRG
ncbi:MAG: hypothetical protein B6D55_02345 [Candidatus Omnitrophica bacterium 4484_70.2]|nr:MAG: hypothetical protein B6D55_02345 [Candidatus Omnitrophica bacterium 4484_70.2]